VWYPIAIPYDWFLRLCRLCIKTVSLSLSFSLVCLCSVILHGTPRGCPHARRHVHSCLFGASIQVCETDAQIAQPNQTLAHTHAHNALTCCQIQSNRFAIITNQIKSKYAVWIGLKMTHVRPVGIVGFCVFSNL